MEHWTRRQRYAPAPPLVRQLVLAADLFLVSRMDAGASGLATTVIAGY
jgi:hypothetical protein